MALLSLLGPALGAGVNYLNSKRTEKSQRIAGEKADAIYKRNTEMAEQEFAPYIEGGKQSNALVRAALGLDGLEEQQEYYDNFQYDPGFQAALDLGIQGLDKSAAARGMLLSGGHLKGVGKYVTDSTLNNAYGNRLNRLTQLSSNGQNAASSLANIRAGGASGRANALTNIGNAQANGAINQSNAINHGLNQFSKTIAHNQGRGSTLGEMFTRF